MTFQITMYMYSGRESPQWTIDGAQEEELRRLIALPVFIDTARPIIPWKMGYRGYRIIDMAAPDQPPLIVQGAPSFEFFGAREVEQFLFRTGPADNPDLPLRRDIPFPSPPPDIVETRVQPRAVTQSNAADAVAWNPDDPKWSGPNLWITNCYAYASNRNHGRFLFPGDMSNNEPITGMPAGMLSGVLSDGLVLTYGPDEPLTAGQGLHCCLVNWPYADHHWYRQDADGWWSHKMGSSPITRLDYDGQPIADPRLCNRGPYTIFVAWLRSPTAIWA